MGKNWKCCDDLTTVCAGPEAPASLAEFTFGSVVQKINGSDTVNLWCKNDFYDVSVVDGYNLPISIEPVDYIKAETIQKSNMTKLERKMVCGKAAVNHFDAEKNCPDILKINGTDKDAAKTYCLSICKAVSEPNHRKKFPKLEKWSKVNATEWSPNGKAPDDSDLDGNSTLSGKKMKDLLCCQCGLLAGPAPATGMPAPGCYDNTTCEFGCSSYTDNVCPEAWCHPKGKANRTRRDYQNRQCPSNWYQQKTDKKKDPNMPVWPLLNVTATRATVNPAYIYKKTSPNAYSWQFNDATSTFECRNANYKVTFCGPPGQPKPKPPPGPPKPKPSPIPKEPIPKEQISSPPRTFSFSADGSTNITMYLIIASIFIIGAMMKCIR